jgi:hypothetical protein
MACADHPISSPPRPSASPYVDSTIPLLLVALIVHQCATSLASTFDVDLIHQVGSFLADEAKIKSATVLLAPTCNIQRSPLGGRAFESFSEDPFLSGASALFALLIPPHR